MSTVICIVDTLWKTLKPSAYLSVAAPTMIFFLRVILKISLAMLLLMLLKY